MFENIGKPRNAHTHSWADKPIGKQIDEREVHRQERTIAYPNKEPGKSQATKESTQQETSQEA